METENAVQGQRGKTVRIVTDIPVLVQSENTLTRTGRGKPITLLLAGLHFSLSVTDSGDAVVKIAEPP